MLIVAYGVSASNGLVQVAIGLYGGSHLGSCTGPMAKLVYNLDMGWYIIYTFPFN